MNYAVTLPLAFFFYCVTASQPPKFFPAPSGANASLRACIRRIENQGSCKTIRHATTRTPDSAQVNIVANEAFIAIASCVANMRGIEKGRIWYALEPSWQDGKYQFVNWGSPNPSHVDRPVGPTATPFQTTVTPILSTVIHRNAILNQQP
jgi:hypothetical protein